MPFHSTYVAHTLMNIKLARTKNFTWLNATSTLKHSPQTNVKEFSVHQFAKWFPLKYIQILIKNETPRLGRWDFKPMITNRISTFFKRREVVVVQVIQQPKGTLRNHLNPFHSNQLCPKLEQYSNKGCDNGTSNSSFIKSETQTFPKIVKTTWFDVCRQHLILFSIQCTNRNKLLNCRFRKGSQP